MRHTQPTNAADMTGQRNAWGTLIPHALLLFWTAAVVVSLCAWAVDDYAQFVALGVVGAWVVTLPTLSDSYRLTSPWTLVIFTTYTGLALRGLFITLGAQGRDPTIDRLFLLGQGPAYFLVPFLIHVLGIALVTGLFMGLSRRPGPTRGEYAVDGRGDSYAFSRHTPLLLMIFATIGAVAFIVFVQRTGGFSLDLISAKRSTLQGGDLTDYENQGIVRALNGFSGAAFWVAVAYYTKRGSRFRLISAPAIFLIVLGANSIALPLFASSRSEAGFTLVVAWVVYAIMSGSSGRRQSLRLLVAMCVGLLALIVVMTGLRAAGGSFAGGEDVSWGESLSDALVFNRNFGDPTITAHIVNHVPEVLPYQNGATLVGYLVAPIPRQFWPEKPPVSVGPMIGEAIYGNERSGVPPGLFGDMYLNFGMAGIVIGAVALGIILATVARWRNRIESGSVFWSVVYACALFRIGMYAMNQGLGFMAFNALSVAVPVLIVLSFVRSVERPASRA